MSFSDNCYQYSGLNLDALGWRKSFMIPGCFCCFFFQDFSTKIHYVSNEIRSRFKIDFMKTAQSWFLRRGSQILREELQLLQSRFWKKKTLNFLEIWVFESSRIKWPTCLKVKWDGQSRVFTWWITTSKADTLVCLKFVFNVFLIQQTSELVVMIFETRRILRFSDDMRSDCVSELQARCEPQFSDVLMELDIQRLHSARGVLHTWLTNVMFTHISFRIWSN